MRPESGRTRLVLSLLVLAAIACGRRTDDALGPSAQVPTAASPAPPPASPSLAPSSPAPANEDASEPAPSPSPSCIHGTDHGVHSVSLAVYFLECGGQRIPGSEATTTIPLGCRIHFNATPRDGMGKPTCSRTWPVWQVGPEELVSGNGVETFTPAYATKREGRMSARCIVDGVRSPWLIFDIVAR